VSMRRSLEVHTTDHSRSGCGEELFADGHGYTVSL
jgi:hypothetical protein